VRGEPFIRHPDQILVEPLLAHARFAAADQENRASFGVEGEGDPLFAIG
jgi:hypothetical protein